MHTCTQLRISTLTNKGGLKVPDLRHHKVGAPIIIIIMLSHVVEAIHFGLQVEETVGMQLNSTRLDLPGMFPSLG